MLRLSPDQVGVALYPGRLVLARVRGGLRGERVVESILAESPTGTPAWQGAVDALTERVAAGQFAGARVTVVLSSLLVRYALVPWDRALTSEGDRLAYARHRFVSLYGKAAEHWIVRLSAPSGRCTRIACVIEPVLAGAIEAALAPLRRRFVSLQPHLSSSFNCWRRRLSQPSFWFVVVEPGLVNVARVEKGDWVSLRSSRIGTEWPEEIANILAREECVSEHLAPCRDVMVFAPHGEYAPEEAPGGWKFRNLLPGVLSERTAGAEAPFSAVHVS